MLTRKAGMLTITQCIKIGKWLCVKELSEYMCNYNCVWRCLGWEERAFSKCIVCLILSCCFDHMRNEWILPHLKTCCGLQSWRFCLLSVHFSQSCVLVSLILSPKFQFPPSYLCQAIGACSLRPDVYSDFTPTLLRLVLSAKKLVWQYVSMH